MGRATAPSGQSGVIGVRSAGGWGFAVMLAAGVAACAPDLGPVPQLQSSDQLATARNFVAPAAAWPKDEWWKVYGDPVLDRLIAQALAGSPDLKLAEARLREADAAAERAGAPLWPQLGLSGAALPTQTTLNQGFPPQYKGLLPHNWHVQSDLEGTLAYEFDFFGKNRAALAAATSEAQAAAVDADAARIALSTSVAAAYAELLRLDADHDAALEALRVRKESAALVAQRYKQALENAGQLSEANALVANAQADVDVVEGQIARARHALAALIGAGPDAGLDIAPSPQKVLPSFGLPPALALDLVGRRPDIVAARLRTEAAADEIKVAHAAYYPNIDLTGFYGVQSIDIKSLISKDSMVGQLGPALTLPLFDGGAIEGGYRAARARYDEAVADYDRTLVHALQDVADAASDCRESQQELADARAALADSENAHRIATLRYQGGLSRYLDVLTAEDTLVAVKRRVADLEARAFYQDVVLVRALGGGYREVAGR